MIALIKISVGHFYFYFHVFDFLNVVILVICSHTAALWMQWSRVKVLEAKPWCENS